MKNRSQTKLSAHQAEETFQEVLSRNIARRSFLTRALIPRCLSSPAGRVAAPFCPSRGTKRFEIPTDQLDDHHRVLVGKGYDAHVLIPWRDENSPGLHPFSQAKRHRISTGPSRLHIEAR